MNIRIIDKQVASTDATHTLMGKVFLPDETTEIRGLLHVVHGMTEHIERYKPFMTEMATAGYIVFGYDHLGHGKTARSASELGYFAKRDGLKYLAADVAAFAEAMKKDYPGLPYYLMGHSMGSFIVRISAEQYCTPDKLIIMGTGGPNLAAPLGIALTGMIKHIYGDHHISPLSEKLAFGSYNNRFREDNDRNSWLTKDPEVRHRYANDPLCRFHFTVSAMQDLIRLNKMANRSAWFQNIASKKRPILLVSGEDDPVGNYGSGVRTVKQKLTAAGADVTLHLYPACRHEILNDTCAPDVIRDIKSFLEK